MAMGRPDRLRAVIVGALLLAVAIPLAAASAPRIVTEDEIVLSNSPAIQSVDPRIVVTDDGTVHVVWQEGVLGLDPGEPVIMHTYLPMGGSWSAPTEVYWDGVQPAIATDGITVGVTFVRNPFDRDDTTEVLYKIWDRTTEQWPPEPNAIEGDAGLAGSQPSMAFDRFHGYLWLVWLGSIDEPNASKPTYARIVVDTGVAENAGLIDEYEKRAQAPVMAVSPENDVHACWSTGYASGEAEINCWEWSEGGTYWTYNAPPLWDQYRQARAPSIDIDTELICVTWHEGSQAQPNEVILSCDKPSGNVWFGNISWTAEVRSLLPSIALDEQRGTMVLWRERRATPPQQIVFGQGLPPPVNEPVAVTNGTSAAVDMPSLSYHESYAYAVWVEYTTQGGADVKFARWEVTLPTPTPSATHTPTATFTSQPTSTATPTASPTGTVPTATPTATAGTPATPEHSLFAPRLDKVGRGH